MAPNLAQIAVAFGLFAAGFFLVWSTIASIAGLFSQDWRRALVALVTSLATLPLGILAYWMFGPGAGEEVPVSDRVVWILAPFALFFALFAWAALGVRKNPTLRWMYRVPLVAGLIALILLTLGVVLYATGAGTP